MNKIPENWITYKISDLCDFQNGYAFNSSDYVEEGMPIIRMSNISIDGNLNLTSENTKYYPREKAEILKKYVLNKNDVVMAMTDMTKDMGIIGKTAIIDEDNKYLLNQRVGRLIIKNPKILDYKYLHRYTNSPRFLDYAKQHCSGGVQLNLSTKAILNHKIILPSTIEEQEEIAQVLDTMSDIIRLREECISHAQDLIPALFQEIFKPYVNYTKKTLNNLFEFKSGGTPSRLVEEYFQGDIPWITTVALSKLYINEDDANELITEEAIQNSSTKLIPANSLLFGTRVGIGKLAINTVPMCTNQDIVAMIPLENNNLNLIYVYWYLKQINNFFVANGRGATIQGITTHLVRSTEIILPPLKIQEQFAQKVIEIESYIKEQQEELENAKQMFQSLLHHAFTGDLTRKKYGGST